MKVKGVWEGGQCSVVYTQSVYSLRPCLFLQNMLSTYLHKVHTYVSPATHTHSGIEPSCVTFRFLEPSTHPPTLTFPDCGVNSFWHFGLGFKLLWHLSGLRPVAYLLLSLHPLLLPTTFHSSFDGKPRVVVLLLNENYKMFV